MDEENEGGVLAFFVIGQLFAAAAASCSRKCWKKKGLPTSSSCSSPNQRATPGLASTPRRPRVPKQMSAPGKHFERAACFIVPGG